MDTNLKYDFAFWVASKVARDTVMKTILATLPADFRNATPDEQERVLEVSKTSSRLASAKRGLRNDAAVAPLFPRYDLERIAVPTLVISAEDDLFVTFKGGRYTAEHIPGARFERRCDGFPSRRHSAQLRFSRRVHIRSICA